jgi:zinc transporter 1/2/3
MVVFLLDFGAKRYVEMKYGIAHGHPDVESTLTNADAHGAHQGLHSGDQNDTQDDVLISLPASTIRAAEKDSIDKCDVEEGSRIARNDAEETAFRQQIAAFLVLEFGVILHSVIIGLNLGTTGDEFSTLYPVLVFHQSFEGLGIGARLSAIPIPKRLSWLPWILCGAYGLVTPVAIAVGLGISTTYNSGSFTANVVSGVLDAISAGILIYTGLVELLARDFLFNPDRSRDNKKLTFMVVSVLFGAGIMALLGKWA